MFIQIMIVIIVLSDFLSVVYAKQRLLFSDTILLIRERWKENAEENNSESIVYPAGYILRVLANIVILLFWLYAIFFVPAISFTIVLNIALSLMSVLALYFLQKNNPDLIDTFYKRLWLVRIDAAISMIIWMPHFLPLLALAF